MAENDEEITSQNLVQSNEPTISKEIKDDEVTLEKDEKNSNVDAIAKEELKNEENSCDSKEYKNFECGKTEVSEECESCKNKEECVVYKKIVEEKIKSAKEDIDKRKKSRGKFWSFIFLLINIVVIAIVVIMQVNTEEGLSFQSLANLLGDRWWYLLLALGSFLVYMLFDTLRYWVLIKKSTGHNRPFLSYKVAALGAYYDNITPLATGGQPFQIFYMINRGVKGSVASGVPFARSIFAQLVFVVVGICVLIFSKIIAGGLPQATYFAAVIGVLAQVVLTATIILLSVSKHIGPTIVKGVLKFLSKIKIIKKPEKTFAEVMSFVRDYQYTMRYIMSSIGTFLIMAIDSFLTICIKALIPFFICCAFVGFSVELYGTIFILSILIDLIMSYIPWPGASGVAEVSFGLLFSHELVGLTGAALIWAMLLWRVLTYYSFLIQGLCVLLYDFMKGNKKIPKTIEKLKEIDAKKSIVQNE